MLLGIPFDVILRIVQELEVPDLLALNQTCRELRALCSERTTWLALADAMSLKQPLPLPPSPGRYLPTMTTQDLQKCLNHAYRLDKNWSSRSPKVKGHVALKMPLEDDYVFTLLNLCGSKEVVTSLRRGALYCWNIQTGTAIGQHKTPTGFEVSRWRDTDDGATMLFRDYFDRGDKNRCDFQVVRLTIDRVNQVATFTTIMDFPVFDLPILYTFIQDGFIGVLSGTGIAVLTLLDMRDRSIRSINTGIRFSPCASTIFSTKDEISLCNYQHSMLDIHVFPFKDVLEMPADAGRTPLVRPRHSYKVPLQTLTPETHLQRLWYTLSRRWENVMTPSKPPHSVTFLSASFRVEPSEQGSPKVLTSFSNLDIHLPIGSSQTSQYRFVSDIPVMLSTPLPVDYDSTGDTGRSWPIVALERRYAIWLEGAARESVLRLVKRSPSTTKPNDPEYGPRTLVVPPELNLDEVTDLTFDESFGAVFVMTQGVVWVLNYA